MVMSLYVYVFSLPLLVAEAYEHTCDLAITDAWDGLPIVKMSYWFSLGVLTSSAGSGWMGSGSGAEVD